MSDKVSGFVRASSRVARYCPAWIGIAVGVSLLLWELLGWPGSSPGAERQVVGVALMLVVGGAFLLDALRPADARPVLTRGGPPLPLVTWVFAAIPCSLAIAPGIWQAANGPTPQPMLVGVFVAWHSVALFVLSVYFYLCAMWLLGWLLRTLRLRLGVTDARPDAFWRWPDNGGGSMLKRCGRYLRGRFRRGE